MSCWANMAFRSAERQARLVGTERNGQSCPTSHTGRAVLARQQAPTARASRPLPLVVIDGTETIWECLMPTQSVEATRNCWNGDAG